MSYPTENAAFYIYLNENRARAATYGSDPSLLVFTRTLTSLEIKALKATPLALVPAPGAGLVIAVEKVILHMNFLTAAYTTGTAALYLGAAGDAIRLWAETIKPFDAAANETAIFYPDNEAAQPNVLNTDAKTVNQALSIVNTAAGGEFAAGSGTIDITIFYRVVPVTPV